MAITIEVYAFYTGDEHLYMSILRICMSILRICMSILVFSGLETPWGTPPSR